MSVEAFYHDVSAMLADFPCIPCKISARALFLYSLFTYTCGKGDQSTISGGLRGGKKLESDNGEIPNEQSEMMPERRYRNYE